MSRRGGRGRGGGQGGGGREGTYIIQVSHESAWRETQPLHRHQQEVDHHLIIIMLMLLSLHKSCERIVNFTKIQRRRLTLNLFGEGGREGSKSTKVQV